MDDEIFNTNNLATTPVDTSQPVQPDQPRQQEQLTAEAEIDAIEQFQKGNPFPLIVALRHGPSIDINTLKSNSEIPILHSLVGMSLPLNKLLPSTEIQMTKDKRGRTPLFYAMEAMDAQAVHWCLTRQPEFAVRDNEGITPAMIAIEKNFMTGLMLCMHFGHVTDDIPHCAARYDCLWALKFLRACKIDLFKALPYTPLEIAVQNYSYECAYYLARLNPDAYDVQQIIGQMPKPSESMMIVLKDYQIYKKLRCLTDLIQPSFTVESFFLLSLFLAINSFPKFIDVFLHNIMMLILFLVVVVFYSPFKPPARRAINILALLKPPNFKAPEDVCPDCVQAKPESYQHCYECGVCAKGFHFHKGVCVFYMNQGRWAIKEFLWWVVLWMVVDTYIEISEPLFTCPRLKYFEIIQLLYNNSTYLLNDLIFYLVSVYWLFKKSLVLVQILYMMFTGYTYQQMMHNERYQYLYRPVKVGEHYLNKRIYVMDNGVWNGLKKIAGNILAFFV